MAKDRRMVTGMPQDERANGPVRTAGPAGHDAQTVAVAADPRPC